ncbi:MAG: mannose-1-phosphate guanylyltransferase [Candidatus Deianiraeaceae bacterium]|jgi:mannose-1-phosphate guanylyltransferase
MSKITPIIIAGGSGTRLWPISTSVFPKQFVDVLGNGKTLFQSTLSRVKNKDYFNDLIIICNDKHQFIVAHFLQEESLNAEVILEPEQRNTAAAIAAVSLFVNKAHGKDSILLFLPADHLIGDDIEFQKVIQNTTKNLDKQIAVFGIKPSLPHTGYGYIHKGESTSNEVYKVDKFIEKPNQEKAESLYQSGEYLWNSGMFMGKASSFINEISIYQKDLLEDVQESVNESSINRIGFRSLGDSFKQVKNISFDYAVAEKSSNIIVSELDIAWDDLGSWNSVHSNANKDANNNSINGNAVLKNSENVHVTSVGSCVLGIDLKNVVIASVKEKVIVCDINSTQKIGEAIKALDSNFKEDTASTVYKPWGSYTNILHSTNFKIKKLIIQKGGSISLQIHRRRAEHWVIIKGVATVRCGEKEFQLYPDQSTYIPVNTKHRISNDGKECIEIIEIQTGYYLEEDDIIRFDDECGHV